MKKWNTMLAVITSAILGVLFVHDFISSEPARYYSGKPLDILLVAVISASGGGVTFTYYRLSWRWRQRAHVLALCLAAFSLTAIAGYVGYLLLRWQSQFSSSDSGFGLVMCLFFTTLAAWLWRQVYHISRR